MKSKQTQKFAWQKTKEQADLSKRRRLVVKQMKKKPLRER